jgi:hypothetical protein
MLVVKIIAYIGASILVFIGAILILGAFGEPRHLWWILVGLTCMAMGYGLTRLVKQGAKNAKLKSSAGTLKDEPVDRKRNGG